jgi:DivIVA domain-containing protein
MRVVGVFASNNAVATGAPTIPTPTFADPSPRPSRRHTWRLGRTGGTSSPPAATRQCDCGRGPWRGPAQIRVEREAVSISWSIVSGRFTRGAPNVVQLRWVVVMAPYVAGLWLYGGNLGDVGIVCLFLISIVIAVFGIARHTYTKRHRRLSAMMTHDCLTSEDVHSVAFSKPPVGERGYDEREVDTFLHVVEEEMNRRATVS